MTFTFGKNGLADAIMITCCFLKYNTGLCGTKITGLEALDCLDSLVTVYPHFCIPFMHWIMDPDFPAGKRYFVEVWDKEIFNNMKGYLLSIANTPNINFSGIYERLQKTHPRQAQVYRGTDPNSIKNNTPKFTFID